MRLGALGANTTIDWVKVLRPTRHKIRHFRDVLTGQSLGAVPKKLNLTQQKQTIQEQKSQLKQKNTRNAKPKQTHKKLNLNLKLTLNFKNCSHVCACHCVQLSYTAQHRTVLIIFPLILQTSSEWRSGDTYKLLALFPSFVGTYCSLFALTYRDQVQDQSQIYKCGDLWLCPLHLFSFPAL